MTLTTIPVRPETRDRLFRLKFRTSYDRFLSAVCDRLEADSLRRYRSRQPIGPEPGSLPRENDDALDAEIDAAMHPEDY